MDLPVHTLIASCLYVFSKKKNDKSSAKRNTVPSDPHTDHIGLWPRAFVAVKLVLLML